MRPLIEFTVFALAIPWAVCMILGGGELLAGFVGAAGFMTFYVRNS